MTRSSDRRRDPGGRSRAEGVVAAVFVDMQGLSSGLSGAGRDCATILNSPGSGPATDTLGGP